MLDLDLAEVYGVPTKVLNQAVKRNAKRFPADFMFPLTKVEKGEVVTNCDRLRRLKFSPHLPNAFTEYGAVMAATVLNSPAAVRASIEVVRAFIQFREMLAGNGGLAKRLDELEKKYDGQFRVVFTAIRALMAGGTADPPKERIGFKSPMKR